MTLTSAVTTSVKLNGTTVSADVIAAISIEHGRRTVLEQPAPAACTFDMLTDGTTVTPDLGQAVVVTSTKGATSWPRFTGTVVAVEVGQYTTAVTCTSAALGRLARISAPDFRFIYGGTGVGQNLYNLLYATGVLKGATALTFTYDPGETTVVPDYVVPAGNALQQCQAIAGYDTQGLFYETRSGNLVFDDANARAFPTGTGADLYFAVSVSAFQDVGISDRWRAIKNLDGLINQATVTYGSPSASVTIADETSQASWGLYAYSEDMPVVDIDDATRRANRLVNNFSQPTVASNPITVDLGALDDAQAIGMLGAEVGTSISWLPGASASGIPGLPDNCYLEGWSERITGQGTNKGSHRFDLWLSDVTLTRTMQHWQDVTAGLKWSGVGATIQWLDLTGQNL